jgi:hypothetical protein
VQSDSLQESLKNWRRPLLRIVALNQVAVVCLCILWLGGHGGGQRLVLEKWRSVNMVLRTNTTCGLLRNGDIWYEEE